MIPITNLRNHHIHSSDIKIGQPIVSIITVTYNAGGSIVGTLDTITAQVSDDYELIVVDGASTDNTLDLVEATRLALPSLTVISEPDNGLYDAMNKGIAAARGEYVIFINAGDGLADHGVIEDFSKLVIGRGERPPAMIYGHTLIEFQNGSKFLRKVKALGYIAYGQPTLHQSVFFRRRLHEGVLYPYQTYKISADYAVMAKMQMTETETLVWDRVVSRFANDTKSVSNRNLWSRIREAWSIQRNILHAPLISRLGSAARRLAANLYYNYR